MKDKTFATAYLNELPFFMLPYYSNNRILDTLNNNWAMHFSDSLKSVIPQKYIKMIEFHVIESRSVSC